MQTEEKDIIQRCREGDKTAFRVVVMRYQRMLLSLALKMLADEEDAKDVVQEAFIKAWVNMHSYDECSRLSTWLYTITSHLCLDRLKVSKRQQPLPEDEAFIRQYLSESDSQRQLENKDFVSLVRVIAQGLSEKQQLVFTLSQFEGLDSSEIEVITGMDATQVKSNLYYAKKTIRERLTKLGYV